MSPDSSKPPISEDGRFWWDGSRWQSLLSADGRFRWSGTEWQPLGQARPGTDPPSADHGERAEAEPAAAPVEVEPAKPLRGAHAEAEPAAGPDQAEPAKPLAGAVDWGAGVEPSKPVAGGIDWSHGVDPYADVAVISGEVADRPNWLHSGERYDERFLAPAANGEAPALPANRVLMPWNYVPGPQKSRIIPIVGAGVVALLAVFWVATSAGVTVTPPDLPFLSRDETANSSTPTPKPSPKLPAEVGRYPHAGERYAAVVGVDSARLNASLADVTSSCAPEQPVEQCRPAAQNALAAVQAFRQDLAALTVPTCAQAANAELQRGLQLYAAGLNQMANAESGHPEQLAAGEATFDLGSQHLIAYDRLLKGADVSTCH